MIDRRFGAWLKKIVLPVTLGGAMSTIGAGEPAALPLVKLPGHATPLVLVEDAGRAGSIPDADAANTREDAPLGELTEALAAARAGLEKLHRATGGLAGAAGLRAELAATEEENRALLAELQTLRERRAEWQRADAAARAEIAGLGQAIEEAAAEAKRLDGELAAERLQNAQLSTSLDRARTEQQAAQAETEAVRAELAEARDALAAASRGQEEIAGRTADLQAALDEANSELGRVHGQLRAGAARSSEVNAALSAAEQERDTALGELDEERARADRLRAAFSVADADLAAARAANRGLEARLAGLEEAAMLATDAARQNLLAVEKQIAALSSTLAEVEPALDAGPAGAAASGDQAAVPAPSADRPAAEQAMARAAGPADSGLAATGLSESAVPAAPKSPDDPLAALPVEGKIQMQSLLADLAAEPDPQGVKLIVPGGELFTVNGQQVRDTAHDSLAKVAELISLYKSQPVLIIGHTDAIGATDYNQTLSERRAGLVKQFFIDHFDVEAARLSTQGMGEQEPIASNATAEGRRANRRVEVLILN